MRKRPNLGWIFYRKAFEHNLWMDGEESQKAFNKEIIDTLINPGVQDFRSSIKQLKNPLSNSNVELVTTYPGLLIGSGYNHEAGLEGELKLGFFFDYTTGLPLIPGTSVKGALRRVFPGTAGNPQERKEKEEFLRWLLQDTNQAIAKVNKKQGSNTNMIPEFDTGATDIKELERQIFEGVYTTDGKERPLPMHHRDLFYDAYPIKYVTHPEKSGNNHLLATDYITPHKHTDRSKAHLDSFTEPTPIQFLKVAPGVAFRFQFRLQDSHLGITASQKELLFRQILLTLGAGSKTNVGYGQFLTIQEFRKLL